ncbi:MAG: hypothetical protein ACXADA_05575 [Candidatus Hodarchaeales archaeon]
MSVDENLGVVIRKKLESLLKRENFETDQSKRKFQDLTGFGFSPDKRVISFTLLNP